MSWRLAITPTSTVGQSVASLCSRYSAAPSVTRAPSSWLHHGILLSPGRGLCWVRRTPPFPQKAATPAALLQNLVDKKHLLSVDIPPLTEDVKSSIASGLVENAYVSSIACSTFGDGSNLSAEKATILHVNAVGNSFQVQRTAVSTAAITFSNAGELHEEDISFEHSADGNHNTSNISPSASESSANGTLPPDPMAGHSSPDITSGSKTLRGELTKGCKFRRMLNSSHAVINDHKDKQLQWFPYLDQFKVKDKILTSTQIIDMLGPFMLEERKERIKRVVANRTYTVCPVVEGLLDLGNIAAVLRSADALGFQSVHVISNETDKRYKKNRKISLGSEKWLDAELYQSTGDCFEELRSRGYRIAVASLTEKAVPICDMDWTVPTAVVFGNEYKGVSMEAAQLADFSCYIPMEGMVDSFNVSVAVGIILHHVVKDRKTRLERHGDLGEEEQRILSADFYLRHNSRSLSVIDRLLQIKQEVKKADLRSVLNGDLELDIELPEYLKLDLEKVCSEFNPS